MTSKEALEELGYKSNVNDHDFYYRNTGNDKEVQIIHVLENLNKISIGNYTTDIVVDFKSLLAMAELIKERMVNNERKKINR